MPCAICKTRRPRRLCPGVGGDICTLCCGAERENSVDCPLDCEYLREAHLHEQAAPFDRENIPNRDVPITEEFLQENEELLIYLAVSLLENAMCIPGTVDFDVRETLDSLIRTYRTLQTGLYYDSLPANPLAARLCAAVQNSVDAYRKAETEQRGMSKTRDATILGLLVFLQHLELTHNNGRRRGRAFLDALSGFYPPEPDSALSASSSLILP